MHYKAAWACGQAALRLAHMPTRRYAHHRLSPLVSTRNDEGPSSWITKAADQFHLLMQESRAFMEGELRTMAGWVDMPDR